MTHWRKTSRSASGAQPLTGSHGGNAIHTAEIISLADHQSSRIGQSDLAAASERGPFIPEDSKSAFDLRELLACCLFVLVALSPAFFVGAAVVLYALLIAEPI